MSAALYLRFLARALRRAHSAELPVVEEVGDAPLGVLVQIFVRAPRRFAAEEDIVVQIYPALARPLRYTLV